MIIYRNNNTIVHDLQINESTTINNRLMVENTLALKFDAPEALDFRISDYVILQGERYELCEMPELQIADNVYSYSALFMGNLHRLDNWLVEDLTSETHEFFATIGEHLDYIFKAINEKDEGWTIVKPDMAGIDPAAKSISYESVSCLSALHKVAQTFEVEFDVKLKVITFARKIERGSDYKFEIGCKKGLYKISRGKMSGKKVVTRLVGFSGKANLKNEIRLSYLVQANVDLYGLKEDKVVFDYIFPRHKGALSNDATRVSPESKTWSISDYSIDFDLKAQLLKNSKIVFTTGACAGLEFEITQYDHSKKLVTFNENVINAQSDKKSILPNELRFPQKNDKYHFINIIMPESYIKNAEQELKDATLNELRRVSVPQQPYTIDVDPRFIKENGRVPENGDLVRVINKQIGLDAMIRVIGIKFPVTDPYNVELTVSDNVLISESASLLKQIRKEIAVSTSPDSYHPFGGRKNLDLDAFKVTAEKATFTDLVSDDYEQTDSPSGELINSVDTETPSVEQIVESNTGGRGYRLWSHITDRFRFVADSIIARVEVVTDKITARKAAFSDLESRTATLDQIVTSGLSTPEFSPDLLLGYGAAVVEQKDAQGVGTGKWQLWADRGFFRDGIETLKLVFNQIDVTGGELWLTDGGAIDGLTFNHVRLLATEDKTGAGSPITINDLICSEDGDILEVGNEQQCPVPLVNFNIKNQGDPKERFVGPFRAGDIVMGVVEYSRDQTSEVISIGKRCYMLICEADGEGNYQALPLSATQNGASQAEVILPFSGMVLARWGNIDPQSGRQGSLLLSGHDSRITITDGVDSAAISQDNTKVVIGNLNGLTHSAFRTETNPLGRLNGYGIMTTHGFFHGDFVLRNGNSVEQQINTQLSVSSQQIIAQVNNGLNSTGIDITNGKIVLDAKSTQIKYKDQDIALFEDGKLSANLIDAKKITVGDKTLIDGNGINAELINASKIKTDELKIGTTGLFITKKVNNIYKTYINADYLEILGLTTNVIDTRSDDKIYGESNGIIMKLDYTDYLQVHNERGERKMYISRPHCSLGILGRDTDQCVDLSSDQGLSFFNKETRPGSNNKEYDARFHRQGIILPPTATINMPGIIAAGRVNADATNGGQWGCVPCKFEKYNYEVGKYKIIHNLGHTDYFITATPVSENSWTKIHCAILVKWPDYAVVGMFDSGLEHKTKDYAFEFMIVGKTK